MAENQSSYDFNLTQANQTADFINKLLLTLNSGALLSTLQIAVSENAPPVDKFFINPALVFAAGITFIFVTFASNYFLFYFAVVKPTSVNQHIFDLIATPAALISAGCFLTGIWVVSLGLF